MALSKERKDEITRLVLKHQEQNGGMFEVTGPLFRADVVARACVSMNIPRDEAVQFIKEGMEDDMRKLFTKFDRLRARGALCDGDEEL